MVFKKSYVIFGGSTSKYLLFLTGVGGWSGKGLKHPYVNLKWPLNIIGIIKFLIQPLFRVRTVMEAKAEILEIIMWVFWEIRSFLTDIIKSTDF